MWVKASNWLLLFRCSLASDSLWPHGAAFQASLSFTISQSLLKLMFIKSKMSSNHPISLILCHPLLLPPSIFPSIRVLSNESALYIMWPEYESFSFSSSPSYEYQGWLPLGLTGLISSDSQESSPAPQFESISFSVFSLLYGPTLTFIHDYWKNHSFDYMDLCQQNDVSAFLRHCPGLS